MTASQPRLLRWSPSSPRRLHCERVSIGFLRGGQVKIDAVSHSAQFKERTNLLRAVAAAMDEAIDQGAAVGYPPPEGVGPAVTRAHENLVRTHSVGSTLSVPLASGGKVVGAMTLERPAPEPMETSVVELCEAVAGLAGPMLDVHRREDQWFLARLVWWLRDLFVRLFGPRHPGLKLGALLVVAALAFLVFAQGDYRVKAETLLEPLVQQAAVAPFNGYIREAPVRAGDLVKRDDVLAVLEDRELKLERLKWAGQQEELNKQLRQAMAERNPSQIADRGRPARPGARSALPGGGPAGAHAHHRALRRCGGVRRPDAIAGRTGGARYGAVRGRADDGVPRDSARSTSATCPR